MRQLLTMSSTRSCLTAARNLLRPNVMKSTRSCSTFLNQSLLARENAAYHRSKKPISCSTRTFMYSCTSATRLTSSSKRTSTANFATYPPHTVLPMPALSPTMMDGEIVVWYIAEGDKFKEGQAILEVETDKATIPYNATEEGYLAKILIPSGKSKVEVGKPLMITVEELADVAAFANYSLDSSASPSTSSSPVAAAPTPAPSAKESPVPAPVPVPAATSASSPATAQQQTSNGRAVASPFARKLLRDAGLPPSALLGMTGSGAGGRIVSADVIAAIAVGMPAAAPQSASTTASTPVHVSAAQAQVSNIPGIYSDFELSDIARAVAARHTASMQQVPHYYLSVELNLGKLLELRESLNDSKSKGADLSVLDFFVKASALAVAQVPDVNSAWMDKFVRRYDQVDINLIVGTGQALSTPLLRNVQSRGLSSISSEISDFEDLLFSEEGSVLDASRLAVGTFSIHNLGMYGVKSASPIVLAPQACALALGSIIDTVVPRVGAKEGENDWVVAPVMVATLSCDHRVVDGAVGAQWLAALKTFIENPTSMLL